jgi:phosphohistidine phosphatase
MRGRLTREQLSRESLPEHGGRSMATATGALALADAPQFVAVTGTKRLFILRHAKSSWDDPGLDDHERPLAPRGLRAVAVLAEHLKANGIEPELVLCSTSRRTRETLEGIHAAGEHVIEPELYGASTEDLVARLRRVPAEVESVMVVGHNPTMQTLVLRLASDSGSGEELSQVQAKFPTGALATLTFDSSWSELSPSCARLTAFVGPKSLAGR